MLTYQQVMSVRLSPLVTAAASWGDMAEGFERLGDAYSDQVLSITTSGAWVGASATAAKARFQATRRQYTAAGVEARAVASLLRDAHAQFTARIRALHHLVAAARKAGMSIDSKGIAHEDPEVSKERKDSGPVTPDTARAVRELQWTQAVADAVRAVDDADKGARLVLRDAAFGGRPDGAAPGATHGFNGNAVGDIEKVEARLAQRYAEQALKGEKPEDLEEWVRLQRDNAGDKVFSRMLLNHLGPEGTIRLANQLNVWAYDEDRAHQQSYLGLQRGYADALASATRDPRSGFYREWVTGLKEAGMRQYEWRGQPIRGYHTLVTLMQQGSGSYPEQLLHDLGDDMIAAEKANPFKRNDAWDLPAALIEPHSKWFANDPLDGLLGIMAREPETAAAFLDPKNGKSHLEYLTRERNWNVVDIEGRPWGEFDPDTPWAQGGEGSRWRPDLEDADTRQGFGAALVAATTGIDPQSPGSGYVQHTEANTRVFDAALEHLSKEGDKFPPSLRTPMALVMSNHGDDVHEATSAHGDDESQLDRRAVLEVAKQISRDQFAYGTLQDGINREIVRDIHVNEDGHEESWRRAGRTIGFLEEARYQGLQIDVDDAKSKATWDSKWQYHGWAGVASYVPVVGDAVDRKIEMVTDKWLEEETKRIDEGRARSRMETNADSEGRIGALAGIWREVNSDRLDGETEYTTIDKFNSATEDGGATARGLAGTG
ncbi:MULTISPECIES: hypothetical protein [Streptomyces]|uniref:Uncharacterized protein n=1 Tax=Streptomyces sudanensis TaxID=436397 RepID=A0ABY4TLE6_9ACTN|nr:MULTISPECIES: hypothetical protein [Streptomyces]URN17830.1 hypothetical protein MW084_19955 [Streptomyces sudanensis]